MSRDLLQYAHRLSPLRMNVIVLHVIREEKLKICASLHPYFSVFMKGYKIGKARTTYRRGAGDDGLELRN